MGLVTVGTGPVFGLSFCFESSGYGRKSLEMFNGIAPPSQFLVNDSSSSGVGPPGSGLCLHSGCFLNLQGKTSPTVAAESWCP